MAPTASQRIVPTLFRYDVLPRREALRGHRRKFISAKSAALHPNPMVFLRTRVWPTNCQVMRVPMINALSVDVEDYFQTEAMAGVAPRSSWTNFPSHVEANTRTLFELLAKYDARATFFFVGWIAERFPALVREAHALGHEVGCHSYWHRPVFRLTAAEFKEDTCRAKQIIEAAAGASVVGYRAPCFSIDNTVTWAYGILEELGFRYDSSVNPVHHPFYGNHTARRFPYQVTESLQEVPVATWRLFGQNIPVAGGAYLRVLPCQLIRTGVANINAREHRPAVLYLHPWEIDEAQPRLHAPWISRVRQYSGLSKMKGKLECLLQRFKFGTVYEAAYVPFVQTHSRGATCPV